jgi:hypothetical protein
MTETAHVASERQLRKEAVARINKKHEFASHLVVYLMVNLLLVAIWATTGAGFFWPVFPLMGWGIGLVAHAWETFRRPPSEQQIEREMERLRAEGLPRNEEARADR